MHVHVLGLVLVFALFCLAGVFVWWHYRSRKVFFENLVAFCDHLLIEISFQKNTIKKIIQTYGDSYGKHFRKILDGYQTLLDEKHDITRERMNDFAWKKLKKFESTNLADFFYELGRHSSNEEHTKIQSKRVIFDNFRDMCDKSLKREASIYLKLLILVGIAAVILLL